MRYAVGRRLLAYVCYVFGALSFVGIPVLWPAGRKLLRSAREAERERDDGRRSNLS